LTYLGLKNTEEAFNDFCRCGELKPDNINVAWMAEWTRMGEQRADLEVAERLEKIAAVDPLPANEYIAHMCRGVASGLRGKLREGLVELKQAISLNPQDWDAHFWKGMLSTYFYEGRNQIAVEALEHALALGLPPVLLRPFHWLETEKPDFYERYARSLLERYGM
jgi:tetratricopeptide (TPR) repeat protein